MKLIYCNTPWENKNKTNDAIENFLEKVKHFDELILAEHNWNDFFLYYLYTTRFHFFNNLISKSDFEDLSKVFELDNLEVWKIAQVKTAVWTSVDICIKLNNNWLFLFLNNTRETIESLENQFQIDLIKEIRYNIDKLTSDFNEFGLQTSKIIKHKHHI